MTTVWILYDEHGQYSDYGMAIFGVFSSAELAMAAFDEYWREAESAHPSNILPWTSWAFEDNVWRKVGGKDHDIGTVASYIVDAKITEERR